VKTEIVKKPRAFVGGEDIFDFSGLQKTGNAAGGTGGALIIQKTSNAGPALGSKVVNLSAPK
jgi:hypothetical protein